MNELVVDAFLSFEGTKKERERERKKGRKEDRQKDQEEGRRVMACLGGIARSCLLFFETINTIITIHFPPTLHIYKNVQYIMYHSASTPVGKWNTHLTSFPPPQNPVSSCCKIQFQLVVSPIITRRCLHRPSPVPAPVPPRHRHRRCGPDTGTGAGGPAGAGAGAGAGAENLCRQDGDIKQVF